MDEKSCIQTQGGLSAHAVFGPYEQLGAGRYAVEFNIKPVNSQQFDDNFICASVDVAAEFGTLIFAKEDIYLAQLRGGNATIRLQFNLSEPHTLEYRVYTTGKVPLIIEEYCRIVKIPDGEADFMALLDATKFPDPNVFPRPAFFLENIPTLRRLYENGVEVKILGNDVILNVAGLSFYARSYDDLRFIDEIFFQSAYNFVLQNDTCVIDIGMNIGLVSMLFASKEVVKEVHSFEPFKSTYNRAIRNLSLNPDLSAKISANNFGLAETDEETTVFIYDESDSGCFSIRGSTSGNPAHIVVRNAATVLQPIIAEAKSKNRDVIAKVDCEGSEFPIFEVLEKNNLLKDISAFMVEWHRGIKEKTQNDLIAPLLKHGFIVFDRSGKTGNGFFYAVRSSHS
jgi:FkbM family methyltransferase